MEIERGRKNEKKTEKARNGETTIDRERERKSGRDEETKLRPCLNKYHRFEAQYFFPSISSFPL